MKWYRLYKEETEEGAFKVGDRVRVADTYKGKPTTGGRFSDDPPSPGMTGTVVDINRQRYHDFKPSSMGLGMSSEKTRMWYVVRIDDSCRKGCFVPGEYGFDEKDLVKIDAVNESSRFGFSVADKVELTKDKSNSFSGDVVKAGTQGEVVAVDKPMKGVIKVKIEGGKVVSVPERQLKFAGTDNEPWEKFKKPPEPPRKPDPETLARQRPEWIYMEPPRPGYPKWTGD